MVVKGKNLQNIKVRGTSGIWDFLQKALNRRVHKLTTIGLDSSTPSHLIHSLSIANLLGIILSGITLTLSIFFLFFDWTLISKILGFLLIPQVLTFVLQYYHKYNASKFLYYINSNALIFTISSSLGMYSGIFYFYIPVILQILVLFSDEETEFRKASVLSTILFVIVLELTDHSLLKIGNIPEEYLKYFNLYSMIGVSLLSLLGTTNFFHGTDSLQLKKETAKLERFLYREVTDKQNAMEKLYSSLKMQEEVLNSISGAVLILDEKGFLYSHNLAFSKTFCEPEKQNLFYPDSLPHLYSDCENYRDILENFSFFLYNSTESYREIEFRRKKNFTVEYFSLKISRLENSFFRGYFLMHNNITDLKQAKNRVDYFQKISSSLDEITPDILLNVSDTGDILDFSADKSSSLYFPKSEMIGKNIFHLGIPDSLLDDIENIFLRCKNSEGTHTVRYDFSIDTTDYSYEAKFYTPDKKEFLISFKKIDEREKET